MKGSYDAAARAHPKMRQTENVKYQQVFTHARMQSGLENKVSEKASDRFRSEGERRIAATLGQYGIPFVYDQPVTLRYQDRTRAFRPDFYLPEFNLYIEYYGRVGNQNYDLRTIDKQTAYAANNLNVIPLYPWDLIQDWPNYLLDRLPNPNTRTAPTMRKPTHDSIGNRSYRAHRHSFTQPYRRTPRRPY